MPNPAPYAQEVVDKYAWVVGNNNIMVIPLFGDKDASGMGHAELISQWIRFWHQTLGLLRTGNGKMILGVNNDGFNVAAMHTGGTMTETGEFNLAENYVNQTHIAPSLMLMPVGDTLPDVGVANEGDFFYLRDTAGNNFKIYYFDGAAWQEFAGAGGTPAVTLQAVTGNPSQQTGDAGITGTFEVGNVKASSATSAFDGSSTSTSTTDSIMILRLGDASTNADFIQLVDHTGAVKLEVDKGGNVKLFNAVLEALKIIVNGVIALERGASFPSGPGDGDRFYHTGRKRWYVYSSALTKWLSEQEFHASYPAAYITSSIFFENNEAATVILPGAQDGGSYIESVTYFVVAQGDNQTATDYNKFNLRAQTASQGIGTGTLLSLASGSADMIGLAESEYDTRTAVYNALLTNDKVKLEVGREVVGGVSASNLPGFTVCYRLVG